MYIKRLAENVVQKALLLLVFEILSFEVGTYMYVPLYNKKNGF
jgi:hypothetical protein